MHGHTDILRRQVFSFHQVTEEAWEDFWPLWSPVQVKRKELITRQGNIEQYVYLVLDGVQRACYTHHDKDVTLVFSYAPSFSGIIDSFFLQQPSAYHLEAITDSSLLRISYFDFSRLMQKHRSLETWVRVAMTAVLAATLQRQIELTAFSSAEKFEALLRRSPQVLNMIPHKYLASYIGVDPTNFSKLLNNIRL